jgi:hypothetical protein
VIINTGSFVLNFGACAALLSDQSLEIRRIDRYHKNFVLGKLLREFEISQ